MNYTELLRKHAGNKSHAAQEAGMSRAAFRERLLQEEVEALRGNLPGLTVMGNFPDNYSLERVTIQKDADNNVKNVWFKGKQDTALWYQQVMKTIEALAGDIQPMPVIPSNNTHTESELLSLYVVTDYHFGMRAWGEETGADWDITIAEKELYKAMDYMIRHNPASGTAVLGQLGDYLHYDTPDPKTNRSGNILDSDTRIEKMIQVAIRAKVWMINKLLEKHSAVKVICLSGNHDEVGGAWLRSLLPYVYKDNPRVEIMEIINPYFALRFGKNKLCFTHGDLKKFGVLDKVFAERYPDLFGHCPFREIHTGHFHEKKEIYQGGYRTIQHPTLAAPDSYSARYFPRGNNQEMLSYLYDLNRGRIGTFEYRIL